MSIKITYFDTFGVAEFIRYILAYGGQEFQDERVKVADWPALKEKVPLGFLPTLTMPSGKVYHASVSIARHFAEKFKLAGKTEEEKLHANMVVDVFRMDIMFAMYNIRDCKEEERQKVWQESVDKIKKWLQGLEDNYVEGKDTFLASGLSWADIVLYNTFEDLFPRAQIQVDDGLKKLKCIQKRVKNDPRIVKYIAERPAPEW